MKAPTFRIFSIIFWIVLLVFGVETKGQDQYGLSDSGKKVLLRTNGTWEYVKEKNCESFDEKQYQIAKTKLVLGQSSAYYLNNAWASLKKEGDRSYNAVVQFEQAIKLNPTNGAIYSDLGDCFRGGFRCYDKAENYYSKSIQYNYSKGFVYYNRAKCRIELGKSEEMKSDLDSAKILGWYFDDYEIDQEAKENLVGEKRLPPTFGKNKTSYRKLQGKIGEHSFITMNLCVRDSFCFGSFYVENKGKSFDFSGKIRESGIIELLASSDGSEITFEGRFNNQGTLKGTWSNTKSKQNLTFKLNDVSTQFPQFYWVYSKGEDCSRATESEPDRCDFTEIDLLNIVLENEYTSKKINQTILEKLLSDGFPELIQYLNAEEKKSENPIEDFLKESYLNPKSESEETEESKDPEETNVDVEEDLTFLVQKTFLSNVLQNEKEFVSLSLFSTEMNEGSNLPSDFTTLINFDLKTGNEITLDQIFKPGYYATLNKIAQKFFKSYIKEIIDPSSGVFDPTVPFKIPSNFSIQRGGIYFLLSLVELGEMMTFMPRSEIGFFIPYQELKDLVKPGSIFFNINQ